ncbi:MAG TPA: hypothetical protein VME69_03155, partial [Methylocella sp.]|nr:hypothetical protein [Methylocella sp.]
MRLIVTFGDKAFLLETLCFLGADAEESSSCKGPSANAVVASEGKRRMNSRKKSVFMYADINLR